MNAQREDLVDEQPDAQDLRDAWAVLYPDERVEGFRSLPRTEAEELFLGLSGHDQAELVLRLPAAERRSWLRLLAPDDAVDLIQQAPAEERATLLALLDAGTHREVTALLAYAEDAAGGLMNPRFARVRPDMTVDEAISYLRRQTREKLEMIYYAYVLDQSQKLLGVVSFRELFAARGDRLLRDVMHSDVITAPDSMDQEALSRLFAKSDLIALPIVDAAGHMQGIVTIDDIVDVVQEEVTEDIQKIGGMEALDAPYLQSSFREMLQKRSVWLVVLFTGQMLTVTAMNHYQDRHRGLQAALGVFVPLIISSGGNSGSQASTLVVRAMALGEVNLRDWWRVFSRELCMGLALGALLGAMGLARVVLWPGHEQTYGEHFLWVGVTVAVSLVGVVLWGTIVGSMLPFALRLLRFDPASSSAPMVATLVDVVGLVIYFTTAGAILARTLL